MPHSFQWVRPRSFSACWQHSRTNEGSTPVQGELFLYGGGLRERGGGGGGGVCTKFSLLLASCNKPKIYLSMSGTRKVSETWLNATSG